MNAKEWGDRAYAHATVETRPVALRFTCPLCWLDVRVDYDEFGGIEDELWNGELAYVCPHCGEPIEIEGCEWDV